MSKVKQFPLIIVFLSFLATFCYVKQKVTLYVQAYQLSDNFSAYNQLVDKRDYLLYNLNKQVSLYRINEWAESNCFQNVGAQRVVAWRTQHDTVPSTVNKISIFVKRVFASPTTSPSALAEDSP